MSFVNFEVLYPPLASSRLLVPETKAQRPRCLSLNMDVLIPRQAIGEQMEMGGKLSKRWHGQVMLTSLHRASGMHTSDWLPHGSECDTTPYGHGKIVMADMDVFAAMGISGFGKKPRERQLDPNRFEKNKREDTVRHILHALCGECH